MATLNEHPLLNLALGLLCIGAIVVAYTTVGQASQSTTSSTRTVPVQRGVVQSTVSGSGNIQASSQLNLGFKAAGTVTHIYVTQGEQVVKGQLLATLDPESAEVTLQQAKASLQAAEANLAQEQESEGETSSEATATSASARASAADTSAPTRAQTTAAPTSSPSATATPTVAPTNRATPTKAATKKGNTTGTPTTSTSSSAGSRPNSSSASSSSSLSPATRAANLASARAAVKSDKLTVQGAEQAVQDSKLYAPEDGTIVELSGEVGETVTATGTSKASTSSDSSSAGSATGATGSAASQGSSRESASSAAAGSSPFAVLSDLSSMQLVVPLSESEIGNVRVGQIATVTIEALGARKLAAHVLGVDPLATSSSGVVSYDVTFQLDQLQARLKVGMSATAEVVVKQAEGLNVPSSAISAGAVTVLRSGKRARQSVLTGLAGDSSTIILSGLRAGEDVVLPSSATGSSKTGARSRLGARFGGAGLGAGGAIVGGGPPGG